MRLNYKLPKTLWITFLAFLLGIIVLGLISELFEPNALGIDIVQILRIGILGSIFSFFTYGIIVWPPTLLFMLIFELAFSKKSLKEKDVKQLLLIEFVIVSMPFAVWAITEDYPYWYYFIAVLGISQLIRYKHISM